MVRSAECGQLCVRGGCNVGKLAGCCVRDRYIGLMPPGRRARIRVGFMWSRRAQKIDPSCCTLASEPAPAIGTCVTIAPTNVTCRAMQGEGDGWNHAEKGPHQKASGLLPRCPVDFCPALSAQMHAHSDPPCVHCRLRGRPARHPRQSPVSCSASAAIPAPQQPRGWVGSSACSCSQCEVVKHATVRRVQGAPSKSLAHPPTLC